MAEQQHTLFDQREVALAGLMPSVKAALNGASSAWCDRRGVKREVLLEHLNSMAEAAGVSLTAGGGRLSLAVFEKWLAPRDVAHVPGLVALNVFCMVTGDYRPLETILTLHGCAIMNPEDKRLRDYGQALIEERRARKRKRRLEADLD